MICALAICAALAPTPDYSALIGSVGNSTIPGGYRVLRNGQPWLEGTAAQRLLLHEAPAGAALERGAGRWGEAFLAAAGKEVSLPRDPYLPLDEVTIEIWLAPKEDGSSALYLSNHNLLSYTALNGESLRISHASRDGVLYVGGTVRGQWESAYGSRAATRGWRAGQWHHIAAVVSAARNRMLFYVDGALTADTNEKHYWPPDAGGARFTIGSAAYWIDEVRISAGALSPEQIRFDARRSTEPANGEIYIGLAEVAPGDRITLEAGECEPVVYRWQGVPITEVRPPSTLLPAETTQLDLSVITTAEATCRYSVGQAAAFESMTGFDTTGAMTHSTALRDLSSDPQTVNRVYVRCSNGPDYVQELLYRSLPAVNPHFPRKANLWGSGLMMRNGLEFASKVDLYLGAELSASDISALRTRNPNILVLTSINTVENSGLPEDYYLHDTHGRRIEVWPGTYRLNLTRPYVAEYQARWGHRKMLDSELMYDGCFFDNFFTSQSWLKADIHGNAVELDANDDGRADDPAWLDAAWREGVFRELRLWRELMPHAYASGHLPNPSSEELGAIFNGNSILFWPANVLDGVKSHGEFQSIFDSWLTYGKEPRLTTIEASPQNQVAYGYGYGILTAMPAATQAFARDFYRYLRWPLAFTLMRDAYFLRDLGDIYHGIDWWYDEYDFDLGYPLGPAELVPPGGTAPAVNLLENPSFEDDLKGTWNLSVVSTNGAAGTLVRSGDAVEGAYSARIDITATGLNWHVDFNQRDRPLEKGVAYELSFWAKADTARTISLSSQKGSPDWRSYGLSQKVDVTKEWRQYRVTFEANETVTDSRIQFFLGDRTGTVWFDGVSLKVAPQQVWRREFSGGLVVMNATRQPVTVSIGDAYERFRGAQAPRWQYLVDDGEEGFATIGNWRTAQYDTGQWKSAGPYYHHWGTALRQTEEAGATATWPLRIPEDGNYTIEAWWPDAPARSGWTTKALYEVVAEGRAVASATLDQTAAGDQFHKVLSTALKAADNPVLRVTAQAPGSLVADAIYVWSEARLNDGAPVGPSLTVPAMDGAILKRR